MTSGGNFNQGDLVSLIQDACTYRQATMIRQSIEQHERGECRDGFAALEDMKQKLRGRDGA